MKNLKLIGLILGVCSASVVYAEPAIHHAASKNNYLVQTEWTGSRQARKAGAARMGIFPSDLNRYGKQQSILQLESQFKKHGSLISSDRYALQAKLDRVAHAIRNFKTNERSDKRREYVQHNDQTFQYINDDAKAYLGKK